jgi:dienelactone hydrolase
MLSPPAHTIQVPTADGNAVRGDLYLPPERTPAAVVVLCHGFKGYKTWGFFPYLAGRLRDAGMAALAIDFSLNGTFPEGPEEGKPLSARPTRRAPGSAPTARATRYVRPDLFRENTVARERDDLASTLRSLAHDGLGGRVDTASTVGLFGHSRGGVSAILAALENARVEALCTWSTPDHPDHLTARQKAVWRRLGEYDFADAIDGTPLSLSVAYLDDLERHRDIYDLRLRVERLSVPHLIVHGEMDLAVPVRCAHALHEAERRLRDKRLVIVPRTGHTFGVSDPPGLDTEKPPRALVEVCDATVDWFDTHLTKGK